MVELLLSDVSQVLELAQAGSVVVCFDDFGIVRDADLLKVLDDFNLGSAVPSKTCAK